MGQPESTQPAGASGVGLVRYADRAENAVRAGVRRDDGTISPIAESIAELLTLTRAELRTRVEVAAGGPGVRPENALILPPVDGRTEVWASGVTYERSREARVEESSQATVYELVYDADRPELFAKAPAWRVVTDGEPIGIRSDSALDVPEPELAVVANAHGEIVGYAVCDDVSSRSIEGDNPLYLPQAKVYAGSCAVSDTIRLAWDVPDPYALTIAVSVTRPGAAGTAEPVWQAETSTARMHRRFEELVDALFAGQAYPEGALLSTGTGLVPELDVTLADGDLVRITIEGIGSLTNPVREGTEPFGWLVEAIGDPFVRQGVRDRVRRGVRPRSS